MAQHRFASWRSLLCHLSLLSYLEHRWASVPRTGDKTAQVCCTQRDKLWPYLQSCSVPGLRATCRSEQIVQRARNKAGLLKRLMKRVRDSDYLINTWNESQEPGQVESSACEQEYHDWILKHDRRIIWHAAPPVEELHTSGVNSLSTARSEFSLHEFARLVLVLSTNDELKSALLESST